MLSLILEVLCLVRVPLTVCTKNKIGTKCTHHQQFLQENIIKTIWYNEETLYIERVSQQKRKKKCKNKQIT